LLNIVQILGRIMQIDFQRVIGASCSLTKLNVFLTLFSRSCLCVAA
jgi:hypothetical protein